MISASVGLPVFLFAFVCNRCHSMLLRFYYMSLVFCVCFCFCFWICVIRCFRFSRFLSVSLMFPSPPISPVRIPQTLFLLLYPCMICICPIFFCSSMSDLSCWFPPTDELAKKGASRECESQMRSILLGFATPCFEKVFWGTFQNRRPQNAQHTRGIWTAK